MLERPTEYRSAFVQHYGKTRGVKMWLAMQSTLVDTNAPRKD